MSHTVYLLRDNEGRVLYVGQTNDITRRLREHATTAHWFSLVAHCEQVPARGRDEAVALEASLIGQYRPIHNVQLNRSRDVHPCEPMPSARRRAKDSLTAIYQARVAS